MLPWLLILLSSGPAGVPSVSVADVITVDAMITRQVTVEVDICRIVTVDVER